VDYAVIMQRTVNRSNCKGDVVAFCFIHSPLFQIVIEAKRLNTYFSDIAVDDLKIGRCPQGLGEYEVA
jgi:hypothetical protein